MRFHHSKSKRLQLTRFVLSDLSDVTDVGIIGLRPKISEVPSCEAASYRVLGTWHRVFTVANQQDGLSARPVAHNAQR